MQEIEAAEPDEDARRIEVVRSLCQGAGWTEHTAMERAEDLKVLGDFTTEQWDDALESAFELMPESPYTAAIGNALASQEGKPNLTERRMKFLKEHGGMTYRTLVRHEQEGAELLVKYLDLVKSLSKKDWSTPVEETDPDIELLRQRIVDVEEALESYRSEIAGQFEQLHSTMADLKRKLEEPVASDDSDLRREVEELKETIKRVDEEANGVGPFKMPAEFMRQSE